MGLCEIEDMALGALRHGEKRACTLKPEFILQFLRPGALPGAELPAIAPRGSVTDLPKGLFRQVGGPRKDR